jgi:nitroreductase
MINNPVLTAMLRRKSIRRYTAEMPSDEVVTTIVSAGQQAPFAAQLGSLLLSRKQQKNPFGAPFLFTICADIYRLERIMAVRNWKLVTNDLSILLFAVQDAAYMAQNMVIAAESLGLGSCFLGNAPYRAEKIAEEYRLPERVFPIVQLTMGYPDEDPPVRPRYPIGFTLFEDIYPELSEEAVREAMETFSFENYGWTEHMCRKWGQWLSSSDDLLEQLEKRGFHLPKNRFSQSDVDVLKEKP